MRADPEVSNPDRLDRMTSSRLVVLQPDAVAALDRSTAGSPQQRALISGLAMFMARLEAESGVTALHIEAAASLARRTDVGAGSSTNVPVAAAGRPPAMMRTSEPPTEAPKRVRRTRWPAICCLAAVGVMAPWPTARVPIDLPTLHQAFRQVTQRMVIPATAVATPPRTALPAPPPAQKPTQKPTQKPVPADPQPTVPLHVQINYPQGDLAAAREGSVMARRLRDDGYAVDDPAPVGPDVLSHGTTFFLRRDTAAATVLMKRLQDSGLPVQLPPSLGTDPGRIRIVLFGAEVPVRARRIHRHARRHRGQ